jgi:PhnB protein
MDFTPYLNFNSTCADAFRFYHQVLGGKLEALQTHGDSPIKEHVPPEWHDRVLHACLNVDGRMIMGSDAPPDQYKPAQGMYVSIHVSSADEGARIFTALSEGGAVTMPFAQTFWSPGFGMLVDRFGTPWMVNVRAEGT